MPVLLAARRRCSGFALVGQDPRVDRRVQRLHAPAEHLGEPGDVRHRRHRDARLRQHLGRVAGRHDRHARRGQAAPEPSRPALSATATSARRTGTHAAVAAVISPPPPTGVSSRMWTRRPSTSSRPSASSRTACGNRRCSTSWMRACSDASSSLGRTVTGSCSTIGPWSTSSSTRWTVTPVTRTPQSSASRRRARRGTTAAAPGGRSGCGSRNARTTFGPTIRMKPASRTNSMPSSSRRCSRAGRGPPAWGSAPAPAPPRAPPGAGPLERYAPGTSETTSMTQGPTSRSSSSACRFVPDPEASTAMRESTPGTLLAARLECQPGLQRGPPRPILKRGRL